MSADGTSLAASESATAPAGSGHLTARRSPSSESGRRSIEQSSSSSISSPAKSVPSSRHQPPGKTLARGSRRPPTTTSYTIGSTRDGRGHRMGAASSSSKITERVHGSSTSRPTPSPSFRGWPTPCRAGSEYVRVDRQPVRLVQPARLELALLDPQVARGLGTRVFGGWLCAELYRRGPPRPRSASASTSAASSRIVSRGSTGEYSAAKLKSGVIFGLQPYDL